MTDATSRSEKLSCRVLHISEHINDVGEILAELWTITLSAASQQLWHKSFGLFSSPQPLAHAVVPDDSETRARLSTRLARGEEISRSRSPTREQPRRLIR